MDAAAVAFWTMMRLNALLKMNRLVTLLTALVASATATPVLVWQSATMNEPTVYTSTPMKAEELLNFPGTSIIFMLARGEKGSESLSLLAPQLELTSQSHPSMVHHHVSDLQNGAYLVQEAKKLGQQPMVVSLDELSTKLSQVSLEEMEVESSGSATTLIMNATQVTKKISKRSKQLKQANLLIVDVDATVNPSVLDAAVMHAVEHVGVDTVLLTAVRSIQEVKYERNLHEQRRLMAMQKVGRKNVQQTNNQGKHHQQQRHRRRLEEADAEQADNSSDLEGIYYVAITPNILAGILFFALFATVTWIGISCMGTIVGQDLYVNKMPSIGREA